MIKIASLDRIEMFRKYNFDVTRDTLTIDYVLHGHDFFEIEFIRGGRGYSCINGKETVLQRGRVNLLTTTDFHDIRIDRSVGGLDVTCLRFDRAVIRYVILEKMFETKKTLTFQLEDDEIAFMEELIDYAHAIGNTFETEIDRMIFANLLETIIVMLLKKTDVFKNEGNKSENHVAKAIAYMEMNFMKSPTLQEVSAFLGLNQNYFSTVFHKQTGKTFVQYCNSLKLRYANNLLCSSDMQVNEICYRCGFKSVSAFLAGFKKKYGTTPDKYRRQNRF